ncbi:hypothetical protein similar to synaptobrevin [Blumeria hordei DH14]|uniref:Synaptobrevin n=1 Tax=Blumeria graminis f. sp. hordei (strain DH14) TaxID=546991 RepID=N1JE52_BLUG1|nr:hypothetical protein similar to synaptobrevin [Blumeria hordei DH14]
MEDTHLFSFLASTQSGAHISLSHMISRFHEIFIIPDSETEARLRISALERARVEANLNYAQNLLDRLEQDAAMAKDQRWKHEEISTLSQKRLTLQTFQKRLEELKNLGTEDESENQEDLLGELSNEESQSEETSNSIQISVQKGDFNQSLEEDGLPFDTLPTTSRTRNKTSPLTKDSTENTLRARFIAEKNELINTSILTTGTNTSTTRETLLSHNRTEQEDLANSLLEMAQTLKTSSLAFGIALGEEKEVLMKATQGLDKNEQELEIAQKRMGLLRRVSEGKGRFGRLLMYLWVAGLAVIAVIVVFIMPKLRY